MEASRRTLLIVEDELPLLELIVRECERNNIDAVSARTVSEAQDFLDKLDRLDGVWLDHFLPSVNGSELLKHIRQHSAHKDTAVFLVTNAVEPEIVNEYLKLGITAYFPKALTTVKQILTDIEFYFQTGRIPTTPQIVRRR